MYGRRPNYELSAQCRDNDQRQSAVANQQQAFRRPSRISLRWRLWWVVGGIIGFAMLMYLALILLMLRMPSAVPEVDGEAGKKLLPGPPNTLRSGMHGFVDSVMKTKELPNRLVVFEDTFWQGNRQGPCFPHGSKSQDLDAPAFSKSRPTQGPLISVVAVVRDRTATLLQALQSWLEIPSVNEVVLVDWGSQPPLTNQLGPEARSWLQNQRVRFIFAAEEKWSIVRAYNLGFQFASGSLILKADADTLLHKDFFDAHTFEASASSYFYRGNWRHSPDENNKHLNGIIFAQKKHLFEIMGYDERMENYGHDDADLYQRLSVNLGLQERRLNYSTISHLKHSESQRQAGFGNLKWVDHSRNIRGANETFAPWHLSGLHPSAYDLRWEVQGGIGTCNSRPVHIPPGFLQMLSPSSAESFDLLSHHWALRIYCQKKIHWDIITKLKHKPSIRALMAIYRDLLDKSWKGSYLIIFVRYGVAERLRAYCSAKAFAQKVGASLVTVWAPDEFSKARFSDLLTPGPEELVIEEWHDAFFPKKMKQFRWISYVKNGFKDKGKLVTLKAGKATIVESAHMLATDPVIDMKTVNQCYRDLQLSAQVKLMIDEYTPSTGKIGAYLPLYPGYPRYIQGGHAKPTLEDKDVLCNLKDFSSSLQQIWHALNSTDDLFMSCDTFHVCQHAQKAIPLRSGWIYEERMGCDGIDVISLQCEQVLLADAFILGKLELIFAPENSVYLDMINKISSNHSIIRSPCTHRKPLLESGIKGYASSKCTTTVCKFVGDMLDELESVM
mmetsp:Transcript_22524/g.29474  ORF Transcript_22524/g.29474 Transcript_22524/m.29474 type:complete len:783 (+) Transcript_22524:115-2463(+)